MQMALPFETYYRKNFKKDIEYLVSVANKRNATVIVCGLPVNFDGSPSEQTQKTQSFIAELKLHTNIPIVTEDERFTTLEARRLLIEADMSRGDRKAVIDKVAASYILEGYMNKLKNSGK
jgi:putative Holliday junction resolvase